MFAVFTDDAPDPRRLRLLGNPSRPMAGPRGGTTPPSPSLSTSPAGLESEGRAGWVFDMKRRGSTCKVQGVRLTTKFGAQICTVSVSVSGCKMRTVTLNP